MDYTSFSAVSLLGVSPLLSGQFLLLNFQEHHPLHPLIVLTLICICMVQVCVGVGDTSWVCECGGGRVGVYRG